MEPRMLGGEILAFIGVIMAFFPGMMIKFQIWTQKVIMGANYIPSARTYMVARIFGAFFLVLGGLIIWAGYLYR